MRIGSDSLQQTTDVVDRLTHGDAGSQQCCINNHKSKERDSHKRSESSTQRSTDDRANRTTGDLAISPIRRIARENVDQAEHANSDNGQANTAMGALRK